MCGLVPFVYFFCDFIIYYVVVALYTAFAYGASICLYLGVPTSMKRERNVLFPNFKVLTIVSQSTKLVSPAHNNVSIKTNMEEILLFDQALKKVQNYLKFIGMQIDNRDINRTVWERLRLRWFLAANIMLLIYDVGGEATWLVKNLSTGNNFTEATNLAACIALIFLGVIQAVSFSSHSFDVCELISSVRVLLLMFAEKKIKYEDMKFLKKQIKVFHTALYSVTIIAVIGIVGFGVSPFVYTAMHYYSTGEVKLKQPFLMSYPFDATDIHIFPFVYVLLMWSAVVGVLAVLGPYFLGYACSTFIIYLFRLLKQAIENLIPRDNNLDVFLMNNNFKVKFMKIIDCHRKLIQCVDLMEAVFSVVTLFNVVTSSLIICLTGFNVMVIEDLALMLPFLQFLLLGLVRIYYICYYGDMIITHSTKISEAVYNCQWYRADASIVKALRIIVVRAQKPCKLTALKFSDVNFATFTKILSTSWTYFAMLKTLYKRD